MTWSDDLLERLTAKPVCGYGAEVTPATEPTALTALALQAYGKSDEAKVAADFLQGMQLADGSVGVRPGEPTPAWPTSLAVLTWLATDAVGYKQSIDAGVAWILAAEGLPIRKTKDLELGHDTELIGWSWAANTHSWIEPTIYHVLALKAAGKWKHPRVREAINLLIDRQLPEGGCNYGNTTVLGQQLRAHLQPSGMLLLALAGEVDPSGRLAKSIIYVHDAVAADTTPVSLAWALLGLAAVGKVPAAAATWLEAAYEKVIARDAAPFKLALLAHAALGAKSPLITLPRQGKESR